MISNKIAEIKLTRGMPIHSAEIDEEAPFIRGFVAIKTWLTGEKIDETSYKMIPAARYISLSQIEEMTITHEVLKEHSTYCIDPERYLKVNVEK